MYLLFKDYRKNTYYLFHTVLRVDFVCSTKMERHNDAHLSEWAETQRSHVQNNGKMVFTGRWKKPAEAGFKEKMICQ